MIKRFPLHYVDCHETPLAVHRQLIMQHWLTISRVIAALFTRPPPEMGWPWTARRGAWRRRDGN